MKGVVFTEFLEMVEQKMSLSTVDEILQKASPAHGGTYTAVGTYPVGELFALVTALSEVSKKPIGELVFLFGEHLFGRFVLAYPQFFEGVKSPVEFLSRVDSYIHIEVRKLYPDAELPRFDADVKSEREIHLIYRSPRRLSALAHGLIAGCGKHFGVELDIQMEDVSGDGQVVKFVIKQR